MNILVSACLLGVNCRYNGSGVLDEEIAELRKVHHLIPVCPEVFGGLSTPRPPVEIIDNEVVTEDGQNKTEAFRKGAKELLNLAKLFDCQVAILKKNSPSCGFGTVYDGSFTHTLVPGNGVAAATLHAHGIRVLNEENYRDVLHVGE